ncbi:MAG: RraA family protein [Gammaproteobacteria bacterium]|nr:MAG: RraA family protein [Gammaproteobacteria bacterium]
MSISTADLSDELQDRVRIAVPGFRCFGSRTSFSGIISTVKCFEDNSLVRSALQEPADGRVLVVDGGASMNCALLGDILAGMAADNGWPGIIVNGCIRDSAVIASIDIGVRALDTHPRKSVKLGAGERDVALHFAGIDFVPGDTVYVDEDGILVTGQSV